MSLSVAIVGLPNVGKSTLFNALLKRQQALAANYPFATIEPNVGIVEVPDERLIKLAQVVEKEESLVAGKVPLKPATIEFVDIAGLVAGAAKGEGLGNQFLAHIHECDLICHVLRSFEDPDVVVTGKMDPLEDLETVRTELILKDLESVEKAQKSKLKAQNDSAKVKAILEKVKNFLDQGKMLNTLGFTDQELEVINPLCLLTIKPEIFAINVSESQVARMKPQDYAAKIGVLSENVIVICAKVESELSDLSQEDQKLYLTDLGLTQSGIERMAQVAYQKLGLISFLTAGVIEARAWTIKAGTLAQQAAGVIHTDFVKKFIKAKVCSFNEFVTLGGWKKAAEAGKVRQEGRDYPMHDGDVVEFMIGK
ncbi:redox-regulated ATPase YchF [Candidatus Beckwithbacteria bacterium RBG_13_42_9]|uniref:Ribosome-binding ATPase YchF n=1 Tax=Candidatus Beckwithbacteria bacterium RBG_13_42_9 TaxID=1797457 RepID=A0A1F5E878_9BACT|nr:MAG: redox-regulated ATPase YchF [Candidatus Beckwithbacteria bacterium RBG_13_42_9]